MTGRESVEEQQCSSTNTQVCMTSSRSRSQMFADKATK